MTLRSYSRRLEQDLASFKDKYGASGERCKLEYDVRYKCEQFIDTALRSQLIFLKKLETIVYYCDKDVDINNVTILDVSQDYLESLLRDVRSEKIDVVRSNELQFDFSVLERKQNHINHQLNQHLHQIRQEIKASKYLSSY